MKTCKGKGTSWRHVRRYLDTSDGKSTSNLRRHAKICWGEDAVAGADTAKLHGAACEIVERSLGMPDQSITAMFECVSKDRNAKVTYSHKQHTKTEIRYALISLHMLRTYKTVHCQGSVCSVGGREHASFQNM